MKCAFCGNDIDEGDQYCQKCGRSTNLSAQSPHSIPGSAEEIPSESENAGFEGGTSVWEWIKLGFAILAIFVSGVAIYRSFTEQTTALSDRECAQSIQVHASVSNGGRDSKNYSTSDSIWVSVIASVTNSECPKHVDVSLLSESGDQLQLKSMPVFDVKGAATDMGDFNPDHSLVAANYLLVCHYGDYETQRLSIVVH